jgi:hypothetical protein
MSDGDRKIGKGDVRVVSRDGGISPLFYFAQVNRRERVGGKPQRIFQVGQIVGDAYRPGTFRNLNQGSQVFQLLVVKSGVGGREIEQALLQLPNASSATNRLVVDLYSRMALLEVADPARHYGIDE